MAYMLFSLIIIIIITLSNYCYCFKFRFVASQMLLNSFPYKMFASEYAYDLSKPKF